LAARLELAASLPEVARMNDWLADLFARESVPDDVAGSVKLCLNEIVANAILHGYPEGNPGRIDLSIDRQGDALAITVEDDGIAFDPLSAPDARPMTGLDDARVGGFGIKLFREASRAAQYERSGGRNRLSFVCG
jgi:anti-sigma regulatory factor (Ser/Thr protein kinase)